MSGLEAVEIKLSELERTQRIDSEFYKKENLSILSILKRKACVRITDNFDVSDGNHMSISHDFREEGIRYYRGGDSHNFFIEESNPICIGKEAYNLPTMKRSHLRKNDVLLSIVGTIGNVCVVRTDNEQTCNCKLAILRPKKSEKALTAALFLKSRYGQNQIQKFKRGAVQMGFLLEDTDQIVMPEFSKNFYEVIAVLVSNAENLLITSSSSYNVAESHLLAALGMDNFTPSNEPVAVKSFSESFGTSGRLDAEYYQKKYEDYLNILTRHLHSFVYKEFDSVTTPCSLDKLSYPYIEISNINVGNGSFSYNIIETELLPTNAKICPIQGDLLVSKVRPYRGAVAIIDCTINNLIVSGAFTVLRPKSIYPVEVLAVLMRSTIYKDWFMKWNVGSSYPVIRDNDVLNLPIPIFDAQTQDKIVNDVRESYTLRRQSEQLLDTAKRAVEIAIEENEKEAIKWLDESDTKTYLFNNIV